MEHAPSFFRIVSNPLQRRYPLVFILTMLSFLAFAPSPQHDAKAAEPTAVILRIQYPSEGAKLPYLTRSFIFGATTPGATVSVNSEPASVAPSAGWISYVPFAAGAFHLHVIASLTDPRSGVETSLVVDRTVHVDQPPQTTPAAPARVDAGIEAAPAEDVALEPGDSLHLFIKGSTGARVSASLGQNGERVTLVETSLAALNPSDKERALGGATAGGAAVGGLYDGELLIPAGASGMQHVNYTIVAADGSTAAGSSKGTVTISPPGAHRVVYIVLPDHKKDIDARPYGIIESDPGGGWLFFPPAGTPFEITGSSGDYYRVALGSAEHAWTTKQSLRMLPPGSAPPRAQVQEVSISDGSRAGMVTIHLSARVPFRVDESEDGPTLRVRVYGATASTDYILYGNDRSNIRSVRWDQLSGAIATITIGLRQRGLWGYHADWDGNAIRLVIKKPPAFVRAPAPALRGLLVVIDAGHSPDSGAIGPLGTEERDVNLAIAKRLAQHLRDLGARAVLTRTANVPVGLYDRTLLATRLGADILISVHNNALPDGANPFTHHGYSVYYYQPQSLELGRAIHAAYGRHTALSDYGLYYDNLALARPTEEPAVLTESAFIMWPPEEMLLRSPAFQNKLGATLADGMERWAEGMRTRELSR